MTQLACRLQQKMAVPAWHRSSVCDVIITISFNFLVHQIYNSNDVQAATKDGRAGVAPFFCV